MVTPEGTGGEQVHPSLMKINVELFSVCISWKSHNWLLRDNLIKLWISLSYTVLFHSAKYLVENINFIMCTLTSWGKT